MLSKLFGSNARVKILKIFLMHPGKKYYIRQLARDLDLQVNSVRRELENLEEFGLLRSNIATTDEETEEVILAQADKKTLEDLRAGKIVRSDVINIGKTKKKIIAKQEKKYFEVNKDFVLYEEARALILKSQALYEKDFVGKIQKLGNVKLLVLTGVFVNQEKPIDILIVGKINKVKFLNLVKTLEKELDREISFTVMDQAEFSYRKSITDMFLYDILEGKRIVAVDEIGLS